MKNKIRECKPKEEKISVWKKTKNVKSQFFFEVKIEKHKQKIYAMVFLLNIRKLYEKNHNGNSFYNKNDNT